MQRRTKFAKLPHFGSCPAPLFKIAHAQAPSQPLVYFGDRSVIFRYPEVVHPATEVFGELLVPIVHGDKPGPAGQFFDPSFEFTEGFLRPIYLGSTESETKKGKLVCRDYLAFILVDLELEGALKEAPQALHDPLSRLATLHQKDEVVGIADETMRAFDEAVTVFYDPLSATFHDPDHSIAEDRLITVGYSSQGRLFIVSHTERGDVIRIISARPATISERKRHEN
jgi:uncharacterized DUF497 family protein